MGLKKYWETYFLVKKINKDREANNKKLVLNNEYCENYYRQDDETDDGRGNF